MIISIDDYSEIPIYQQIRDQIVIGLSQGKLRPGEQLPTVRTLAAEIGINTMTVSKSYQLLKQEGYIVTDRRNGARIRSDFPDIRQFSEENLLLLKKIASEAKLAGLSREDFLLECQKAYGGEEL
ncbi:MAG: GntR family transcriptional regulator [Lachnospiraceae bacterium]|nr:GntR family transcriptional regulator [Lachnospiraceae bacterium]